MSRDRSRRIDRVTAEQLLAGAAAGPEAGQASLAGHAALAGLLAAAAAPAADGAPPGEDGALAAFREARRTQATDPGRTVVADTARGRAFTVKAFLAAFAVTAVGGVAVAAGTGNLPPLLGGARPAAHSPGSSPEGPAGPGGAGSAGALGGPSAGPARSDGPAGPSRPAGAATTSTVPVDLAALCRELTERTGNGADRHDLLAGPSMAPLVAAAGGENRVAAYCRGAGPKAAPSTDPGEDREQVSAEPSAQPSVKPSRKPSRTPSEVPSAPGKAGTGTTTSGERARTAASVRPTSTIVTEADG